MTTTVAPSLAERLASPTSRPRLDSCCAREVMTAGVVALPVTASLDRTAEAMAAHGVHGILVVSCDGVPVGWVTADRVLARLNRNHDLEWAVDAIGEDFVAVRPTAPVSEVIKKLADPAVSRIAVQERPGLMPEGVITNLDIACHVGRADRS